MKLRVVAPVAFMAAAIACGDKAGTDPIIPDAPNQAAGGSGATGGGGGTGTAGGNVGGDDTPMPDPESSWGEYGLSADLAPAIHVVAPDEIYAVAGDQLEVGDVIKMWDGAKWENMTDGAVGLKSAFHYIAAIPPIDDLPGEPTKFVAPVTNHMEMWDGLQWNIITPDALGLHAGLHYIAEDLDLMTPTMIYAPVAQQIQMYDGALDEWVPMTDDVAEPYLMTGGFHYVSDTEMYSIVQDGTMGAIMMWDGIAWMPVADAVEGLRPAMHFVSPTEIYAVLGSQICLWNGAMWSVFTDDLAGIGNAFAFKGPDDIYAVASSRIFRWGL